MLPNLSKSIFTILSLFFDEFTSMHHILFLVFWLCNSWRHLLWYPVSLRRYSFYFFFDLLTVVYCLGLQKIFCKFCLDLFVYFFTIITNFWLPDYFTGVFDIYFSIAEWLRVWNSLVIDYWMAVKKLIIVGIFVFQVKTSNPRYDWLVMLGLLYLMWFDTSCL